MANYYCPYCRTTLIHGSRSVVKSHLAGKNHVRLYCEYYQAIARENPAYDSHYHSKEITPAYHYKLSEHYSGMPGRKSKAVPSATHPVLPPPTRAGFPAPPPPPYHYDTAAEKKMIDEAIARELEETNRPIVLPEDKHHSRRANFREPRRFRGGRGRGGFGGPGGHSGGRRDYSNRGNFSSRNFSSGRENSGGREFSSRGNFSSGREMPGHPRGYAQPRRYGRDRPGRY